MAVRPCQKSCVNNNAVETSEVEMKSLAQNSRCLNAKFRMPKFSKGYNSKKLKWFCRDNLSSPPLALVTYSHVKN